MTMFEKQLFVSKEHADWIIDEFKNWHFHWEHKELFYSPFYEEYESNYYHNSRKYKNADERAKEIDFVDKEILGYIQQDPDTTLEEKTSLLEEFEKWKKIRDFWENKAKVYEKFYKKKKFWLDYFPNFELNVDNPSEKTNGLYNVKFFTGFEKHERVHNPIFLALFLQNYMINCNNEKLIKFWYMETAENENEHAGIVKIYPEKIRFRSLEDLCK